MAVLLKFCSEGDNIPDALALVNYLNEWLQLIKNEVSIVSKVLGLIFLTINCFSRKLQRLFQILIEFLLTCNPLSLKTVSNFN